MSEQIQVKRCSNLEQSRYNKMYGNIVRINRFDYQLTWCSEIYIDRQQVHGLCDVSDKIIYIDVTNELEETLLHEIIHAEFNEAGLKQHDKWDAGLEEIIAETISRGLTNIFKIRSKHGKKR